MLCAAQHVVPAGQQLQHTAALQVGARGPGAAFIWPRPRNHSIYLLCGPQSFANCRGHIPCWHIQWLQIGMHVDDAPCAQHRSSSG